MRRALALLLVLLGAAPAAAQDVATHGVSVFGDLKYPAGFKHFDYVNPDAPKGGELRLYGLDSFDTLNPFTLKGVQADFVDLLYDPLMTRALDEPDALYGVVASEAVMPPDKSWIAFRIRPEARFSDGTPITADDAVFTFETLRDKGHPRYRMLYDGVAGVRAVDAHTVRFDFKPGRQRDLPTLLAALPVLSKAYWSKREFERTTLDVPVSSGPYRVAQIEPGRSIVYARDPNYWGRNLPVNVGRHNFDRVRIDYFRDRDIALEAFFAGAYDLREENTSRDWATKYDDKPAIVDGTIKRETLRDHTPSGVQAWFFNLRRERFRDPRVREALGLAFDFTWTNKNLFYGLYKRTSSMFENSDLAAHDPPTPAELKLLEPFRGEVPDEVFTTPYHSPEPANETEFRQNLRKAVGLLRDAGWTVRDGKLRNAKGEPFTLEFLNYEATFSRLINPYIRNLERLGIDATIRVVDVANYINRRQTYDFDAVTERYTMLLTPGVELREYFGSAAADVPGSRNLAGIKDKAVDTLIADVIAAQDRPAMVAAARALDRVLMWRRYSVPQWYSGNIRIAYWDRFSRPKTRPLYDINTIIGTAIDDWWYDAAKAKRVDARLGARTP
jgi:microcin C transport system substrate-binding protein